MFLANRNSSLLLQDFCQYLRKQKQLFKNDYNTLHLTQINISSKTRAVFGETSRYTY